MTRWTSLSLARAVTGAAGPRTETLDTRGVPGPPAPHGVEMTAAAAVDVEAFLAGHIDLAELTARTWPGFDPPQWRTISAAVLPGGFDTHAWGRSTA